MADQPEPSKARLRLDGLDDGGQIIGKLTLRMVGIVAGRARIAAFIVAQYGNALTRQVIGQDGKNAER